MITCLFTS